MARIGAPAPGPWRRPRPGRAGAGPLQPGLEPFRQADLEGAEQAQGEQGEQDGDRDEERGPLGQGAEGGAGEGRGDAQGGVGRRHARHQRGGKRQSPGLAAALGADDGHGDGDHRIDARGERGRQAEAEGRQEQPEPRARHGGPGRRGGAEAGRAHPQVAVHRRVADPAHAFGAGLVGDHQVHLRGQARTGHGDGHLAVPDAVAQFVLGVGGGQRAGLQGSRGARLQGDGHERRLQVRPLGHGQPHGARLEGNGHILHRIEPAAGAERQGQDQPSDDASCGSAHGAPCCLPPIMPSLKQTAPTTGWATMNAR